MLTPRKPLGGQYVGEGGALLTPDQLAERRAVAEALMSQGADFSPAGSGWEAIGRAFNGWWGGKQSGDMRRQEEQGTSEAKGLYEALFSGASSGADGGATDVAAALAGGGEGYTAPAEAAEIREGLIARGLPEHIADGFIMNFQDESGLNPGINERNPTVPGSRGGFGLYQLTGDRRTAYEGFAGERGVDPSDVNAQLDWLMYELQGPEAKAAKAIMGAGTAGEAGAAIVNQFLRPAPEHRTSRANRYMGASGTAPAGPNSQQIMQAMSNPWLMKTHGPQLEAQLRQVQAVEQATLEQQRRQSDPMYQAELEARTLANEAARQPKVNEYDQRAAVGQQFGLQGDALTNFALTGDIGSGVKPTGNIQEYEYYAQGAQARGEQPMPFEQYQAVIARAGSGATPGVGTTPAGYKLVTDPLTGEAIGLEPIPGGPAELEAEKNEAALAAREQNSANAANIVLQDIDKAISQTSGWTAGIGGSVLGKMPGSGATDLRSSMDTIRANIGFDRLQQMRDASPTGGALGGIAIQELQMLQAVLGSLDQSQSPGQLKSNLERLKEIYTPIAEKAAAYPNASQFGFDSAGGDSPEAGGDDISDDDLLRKYGIQ